MSRRAWRPEPAWALLAPPAVDPVKLFALARHPVATVVHDLRTGLLMVGTGQCTGLYVPAYLALGGVVDELCVPPPSGPGRARRPRILSLPNIEPRITPRTRRYR